MIILLHSINHFKNGNFHDFDTNESSHRSDLESSNCSADNYRHFNSVNNNSLKNVCIAFDYCHIKNCSKSVCDCSSGCKSSSESTGQTSSSRHSKENESSGDADRLRNRDSFAFGPPDRSGKDDRSGRRDRSEQDEESGEASGEASGESSGEAGCHGYRSETRYLHESVAGYSGGVSGHLKVLEEVCNDPEKFGESKVTAEILKYLIMEIKRKEREKTTLNLNLQQQNNEQQKQRRFLKKKLQDLLDLERTCQSIQVPLQYRQDLQQLRSDITTMQRFVRNALSLQQQPHLPETPPPTSTPSSLRLALPITTDEPKTDTSRFPLKIPQTSPPHVSNPQKCCTTTSTAVTGFSQRTPRITSTLRAYRTKQIRVKPTTRIFTQKTTTQTLTEVKRSLTQETTTQAHTEVTTSDTTALYTLYSGRPVLVFNLPKGYFETYRRTTSTVEVSTSSPTTVEASTSSRPYRVTLAKPKQRKKTNRSKKKKN